MTDPIKGSVADSLGKYPQNQQVELITTGMRSLRVSQVEPPGVHFAMGKRLFAASSAGGSAKAPVAAVPTTAAAWALYNGSNSRYLLVLKAFQWLVSGTKGLGGSMWGCVTTTVQASAVSAYASSVNNQLGGATPVASAEGVFGGGVTLAHTPTWVALAAGDTLATNPIGPGFVANDLGGLFVVPPGCCMGLTMLDEAGSTPLFGGGFVWAEVELDRLI